MARTGLAQPQPLSRAEALELIAAWLAEQQAVGRQVKRQWELDRFREHQAEMEQPVVYDNGPRYPAPPAAEWTFFGVCAAVLIGAAFVGVWR